MSEDTMKAFQEAFGPAIEALCNRIEDAPAEMSGDGWSGEVTCVVCPVQIDGTVDGARFYFRERGGSITIGIAATKEDAVGCRWGRAPGWTRADDGEVTHSQAWAYVERWIAEWRAEGRPMRGGEGT